MAPRVYENTALIFDVYPKVVLKNENTTIRIKSLFGTPLLEGGMYKITWHRWKSIPTIRKSGRTGWQNASIRR